MRKLGKHLGVYLAAKLGKAPLHRSLDKFENIALIVAKTGKNTALVLVKERGLARVLYHAHGVLAPEKRHRACVDVALFRALSELLKRAEKELRAFTKKPLYLGNGSAGIRGYINNSVLFGTEVDVLDTLAGKLVGERPPVGKSYGFHFPISVHTALVVVLPLLVVFHLVGDL